MDVDTYGEFLEIRKALAQQAEILKNIHERMSDMESFLIQISSEDEEDGEEELDEDEYAAIKEEMDTDDELKEEKSTNFTPR